MKELLKLWAMEFLVGLCTVIAGFVLLAIPVLLVSAMIFYPTISFIILGIPFGILVIIGIGKEVREIIRDLC